MISNGFFISSVVSFDFDRLVLPLFVLGLSQGKRFGWKRRAGSCRLNF